MIFWGKKRTGPPPPLRRNSRYILMAILAISDAVATGRGSCAFPRVAVRGTHHPCPMNFEGSPVTSGCFTFKFSRTCFWETYNTKVSKKVSDNS